MLKGKFCGALDRMYKRGGKILPKKCTRRKIFF
jgi:hypothetical protein